MRRVALSRRIIFGFSAGLLLQLLLSIVVYRNLVALMEVNRWVVHTEDMLATLESLFAQAQDAEVERGYLLTGDQLFLTPYQTARQEILPTFQRLQQLTSDDPLSQSRLVTLESLLKQRLTLAQSVIDVRQARGAEVALRLVQSGRGRALMTEIRLLVEDLRSDGIADLQQRRMTTDRNGRIAYWAIILSNVVALAFIVFVGSIMHQDRSRRKAAERALLEMYTKGESRIRKHVALPSQVSNEVQSESSGDSGDHDGHML